MQTLDFFKQRSKLLKAETRQVLQKTPHRQLEGTTGEQLAKLDEAMAELQGQAEKVTHLLEFVSLNMAALRKILKKFKKHIEPLAPMQGFLALEVGILSTGLSLCSFPPLQGPCCIHSTGKSNVPHVSCLTETHLDHLASIACSASAQ